MNSQKMIGAKTISIVGLSALMLSLNAAAQAPAAKAAVDPKVAECRAANIKTDKEIDAVYSKAKAEGRIVPAEAARFRAMEERIARHRVALAKDGFTLADCQTMAKDYEVEKAAVMKMASSNPAPTPPPANTPPKVVDPKVAECRAANLKTDKEIDATYSKAKAEGKIVPAEAARFRAMEERIARHRAALARDGFTLADCQAMAKDYEVEKAAVMKMATSNPTPPPAAAAPKPVDPKLAECRAANVKTDKEIDAMYNKAKAAGKITPAEAGRFKAMEEKIARHRLALARDGFTLADCESMAKDYAAEKAAVMKIAQ